MATTTRTRTVGRKVLRTAAPKVKAPVVKASKIEEGVELDKLEEEPTVLALDSLEDEDNDDMRADGNPTAPEDDEPVKPEGDAISRLATSIDRFVSVQNENAPVKKVPWSRYKPTTPFNPTGNKKRKLSRRCYQNNHRMFIPNLHDEEISLLNQIEPGTYIDGLVTVVERQNGENVDLHILYKNATQQQRMENLTYWRNFTELLKRCMTEGPTDPAKLRKMQRRSA